MTSHPQHSHVYKDSTPIKKDRPKDFINEYAIGVVNLARLTESNDLLPLALLECCNLGGTILQGFEREDGTREYLTTEDLGRCFTVKHKLALRNAEGALKATEASRAGFEPWYDEDECLEPDVCTKLLEAWHSLLSNGAVRLIAVDQLLAEGKEDLFRSQSLCQRCLEHMDELFYRQRARFWNALPDIFGVTVSDDWRVKENM